MKTIDPQLRRKRIRILLAGWFLQLVGMGLVVFPTGRYDLIVVGVLMAGAGMFLLSHFTPPPGQ